MSAPIQVHDWLFSHDPNRAMVIAEGWLAIELHWNAGYSYKLTATARAFAPTPYGVAEFRREGGYTIRWSEATETFCIVEVHNDRAMLCQVEELASFEEVARVVEIARYWYDEKVRPVYDEDSKRWLRSAEAAPNDVLDAPGDEGEW